MLLVDISVDPRTPVNRDITQQEWAKLFPGEPPRRVYYTFKKGVPVNVEPDKLAKFLMKKFPTVRVTAEDLNKIIEKVYTMKYPALKSMGLKYGWSLKEVSVTRAKLAQKIHAQLQNHVLPMTPEQYEVHKKEQKAKSIAIAKQEETRDRLKIEAKEKEDLRLKEKKTADDEYEANKLADKIADRKKKNEKSQKIIDKQKAIEKKADDAIAAKKVEKEALAEKDELLAGETARISDGIHLKTCPLHESKETEGDCDCGVIVPEIDQAETDVKNNDNQDVKEKGLSPEEKKRIADGIHSDACASFNIPAEVCNCGIVVPDKNEAETEKDK